MPSHYLNHWWIIVNWTPRNKFHWNLNWNPFIFSHENVFENVGWKISNILPQCVKLGHGCMYLGLSNFMTSVDIAVYTVDHSDVVGSFARRRCSNYIFILDLTPGFNGLSKDNCKMRWEIFKFWHLMRLISEVWRYIVLFGSTDVVRITTYERHSVSNQRQFIFVRVWYLRFMFPNTSRLVCATKKWTWSR